MKILFDQGVPVPLRRELGAHRFSTAYEMGWSDLTNGDLLNAAEQDFDALITTDKNIRHQQNLSGRVIAVLVLPTTNWPELRRHVARIRDAVNVLRSGAYRELEFV